MLIRFGGKSYFVWCQEFFFQDSSPPWAYRQSEKLFFSFLFQKELGRRRRIWTRFDGNGGPILSFHSTYDWRKRRRSRTLIQLSSTQGRSWGVADKKDWESNWNDVRRLNAIGGAAVACVRGKSIVTLFQTYSIAPPATFAFRFQLHLISLLLFVHWYKAERSWDHFSSTYASMTTAWTQSVRLTFCCCHQSMLSDRRPRKCSSLECTDPVSRLFTWNCRSVSMPCSLSHRSID